jgi:hypothetical protein
MKELSGMKWIPREGKLPPKYARILVFSPCYNDGDSMRYRVMDSDFFCLATDATHWALLEPPKFSTIEEETFRLEHDDFFP